MQKESFIRSLIRLLKTCTRVCKIIWCDAEARTPARSIVVLLLLLLVERIIPDRLICLQEKKCTIATALATVKEKCLLRPLRVQWELSIIVCTSVAVGYMKDY